MLIEGSQNDAIQEAWAYCEKMLPLVSRTFALNISQLKGTLYQAVLIGYLLFRMADTIEDAQGLSEEEKVMGLSGLAEAFGDNALPLDWYGRQFRPFFEAVSPETPEGDLLRHGVRVFSCYAALPKPYRQIIGEAIRESAHGMARYQERKKRDAEEIFQLEDWDDLTRYCYYVAGIVGKMLTRLFCLDASLSACREVLSRDEIHFGLALQLTNIVKDYPADIARGWCYLPRSLTDRLGMTPRSILRNPRRQRREIVREMIHKTIPYLDRTYRYISEIPSHAVTIRMFCIIPFILAYHTLAYLHQTQDSKLPRGQVQSLLKRAEVFCRSNAQLKTDYDHILESLR